jgi:hypothetical protein
VTTADWINVAAIILSPIIAVGITLWIGDRGKRQDSKLAVLRILLTTRDLPSDPSYQFAVKLIPVEFNDCVAVLSAHREFLEAANVNPDKKSDEEARKIAEHTYLKLVRLLFEMSKASGLKIRETDIQTGNFGTRGFFNRDALLQDSQRAMRDVANILWTQTRLLGGESWDHIQGHATASTENSKVASSASKAD